MLENLLGNAWKFTNQRTTAKIEFAEIPTAEGPTFVVRDNGAGFNADYSGKLFGAFQRLHHVKEFPGSGIGLASVARVIHRHGGKIWAEGREGEGASFYFTLPNEGKGKGKGRTDPTS